MPNFSSLEFTHYFLHSHFYTSAKITPFLRIIQKIQNFHYICHRKMRWVQKRTKIHFITTGILNIF